MQRENKWEDGLRKEWSNTTCLANCKNIKEINKTISDWWLSKVDTAIAEERERIVEMIEKIVVSYFVNNNSDEWCSGGLLKELNKNL